MMSANYRANNQPQSNFIAMESAMHEAIMQKNSARARALQVFMSVDASGSGYIEYTEFVAACLSLENFFSRGNLNAKKILTYNNGTMYNNGDEQS